MALIKDADTGTGADEQRADLWRKRLAREVKYGRARPEFSDREARKDSPRIVAFRTGLRALGLYNRGVKNALSPVLREFEVSFNTLPVSFDRLRILHLSDLHFRDRPEFRDMLLRLVGAVEPDLCVLTGDYRYSNRYPVRRAFAEMRVLRKALRAPMGVLAVLGNNDHSRFVGTFKTLGIDTLVNSGVVLNRGTQSIAIAGVDDSHDFFCDAVDTALDDIPEGLFTLMLAHSPEAAPRAAARGVDLYLCGHTHGGQICLPGIGPVVTNARSPRRRASGFWRYGEMQGYTNRGIGTAAIPVRFGCPPEAAVITLRRA
jgi:uncharacterized protein